jgi:PAS domain S-box-containing protein
MVTISDREGRIVYASPATEQVSGFTPDEFMARNPFDAIHPEDRPLCEEALRRLASSPGLSLDLEHRVRHKDGTWRWVEGTFTSLFDDPDVGGLLATVRDITARKRAEELSRRAADLDAFRVALSDVLRPLTDPIEIQAEAARVLGEHLGANRVMYADVEEDEDGDSTAVVVRGYASGMPPLTGRFRIADFGLARNPPRRADATVVMDVRSESTLTDAEKDRYARVGIGAWVGVPLIKGGRFVAALGVHQRAARDWTTQEITIIEETAERTWAAVERARAEAVLRASEERFRAAFEQANVGIVQTTVEGRILVPNPGFCKIIGYTEEEAKDLTVRDITHPDDYETDMGLAHRVTAGEIPGYTIAKRYVRKGGEVVWVQLTSTLVREASGKPYYALAIVEDVTERKRAERALQTVEANQRAILDSANQSIILLAPDYSLQLFNRYAALAAHKVFGRTMEIGQSILEYVSSADYAGFAAHFQQALSGQEVSAEKRLAGVDGPSWWEFFFYPILLPDGSVGGVTLTSRDISARKQAEEALRDRDEQLALALQAADAGVSSLDLATGTGVTTPQWREVLGFPPPPAPQSFDAFFASVHPEDRERVAALHADPEEVRKGLEFEFRLNHPVKGERWILSRSRYTVTPDGHGRLFGIALDVTERRRTEEERERLRSREAAMRAEAMERERISRELHDRVAHSMGVAHQSLELYRVLTESSPERAREKLAIAEETTRIALDQTRNLAIELRRSIAEETEHGVATALRTFIETSAYDGVDAGFAFSGDESLVPHHVGAQVYLIMREAVRNALKHSGCEGVKARVEIQPGELVGTVTDDGDGFEPAADDGHRAGIGLRSMRERTEMVGGRLDLISHPGDGTTIEIRVPLER